MTEEATTDATDPFQKFERMKSDGTSGLCQLSSPITEEHPVRSSI